MIYLIGSLRNPKIPIIAKYLREDGHEVFDEWYASGPETDDHWRDYEKGRGYDFKTAIRTSKAAKHVFNFDLSHLLQADAVVLALPAGRSAHLELGWSLGRYKPGYILLDDPDRWDVMYQFAHGVTDDIDELLSWLKNVNGRPKT